LLKLAVSADGKAGAAGRKPAAVTGEEARTRVHALRAASDAILVGVGTVLSDDPSLTCRLPGMSKRSPVRIVLDAKLRVPLAGGVIATANETPTWVFTGPNSSAMAEEILRAKGAEVLRVKESGGRLDLDEVTKTLAERGITRLMVEGGPTVAGAFVQADLVDEVMLFRSPKTLGADAIDALEGVSLQALTQSSKLKPAGTEPVGVDTLEIYERT
jgi:diaminohydroxyphosphoribosylaminopyrimidine deaminase/5-amino-6-(5-phosphoribosylamino)uracil reductase